MENKRPEKQYSAGSVKAAVWKNSRKVNGSDKEVEFNTVQLQRSYKDKEGNWQNTGSLRVEDIPKAA